jgi:hypothetical protein
LLLWKDDVFAVVVDLHLAVALGIEDVSARDGRADHGSHQRVALVSDPLAHGTFLINS